jgi:SAM-dependent methyltransferase
MSRHLAAILNVVKSVGYDLRYALSEGVRIRLGARSYPLYRATRRHADYLKHGAALEAVKPLALKYCTGRGVDVGASRWPLPGARPVEDGEDENAYRIAEADGSLDFVFSSHTLEHLARPEDALREWIRTLRAGGVLFLYLPHPACEMWRADLLPFHEWNPDPVFVERLLADTFHLQVDYVTYLPDAYFSFAVVAIKQ